MAITPLPAAPLVTDSQAEFDEKAFAFVDALVDFVGEANALATDVNADAVSAAADAITASNAATSANTAWDSFDDRYLGAKASNPTLDNDGNALLTGALYFNTAVNEMRIYNGSSWVAGYIPQPVDWASPGTIGSGTPNSGAFTTLSATGDVTLNGGSFVFNEAGADKDLRAEGDTDQNLFFLDASTDCVGVGTATPSSKFAVAGVIESTSGGFKFPDGTTQDTAPKAATGATLYMYNNYGGF